MVILAADVVSSQYMKTIIGDGTHLVFLSGIAITPSLEGIPSEDKKETWPTPGKKETWLRTELYIDKIGPQWSTFPPPHNIVAMAFLNSMYKGSSDEGIFKKDKQRNKAGWAIDEIIGTDIKNGKITLKLKVAVYHPGVKLLRVGFYITAIGKVLDEGDNLIVENIYPPENNNEIPKNTSIIITFNIPIDKSSLTLNTFKLSKENSEKAINCKIQIINDKTIVFFPEGVLEPNTKYVARLSKEIKNTKLNLSLKNDKIWSFVTSK